MNQTYSSSSVTVWLSNEHLNLCYLSKCLRDASAVSQKTNNYRRLVMSSFEMHQKWDQNGTLLLLLVNKSIKTDRNIPI